VVGGREGRVSRAIAAAVRRVEDLPGFCHALRLPDRRKGIVRSKGIVNNAQHVGYVLAGRRPDAKDEEPESETNGKEEAMESEPSGSDSQKVVSHL
jgi:hypothetical protein